MIFDYATLFVSLNDSIPPVADFYITDEIYKDFENYVLKRNFNYSTRSEESLKKLIETAKQEKYFDLASSEFSALEDKLTHDNIKDLSHFKDEISYLLKQEIVSRYYYQRGSMEAAIENDVEVAKAIEVLKYQKSYFSILAVEHQVVQATTNE